MALWIRSVVSSIHLLALGIGLGSVFARGLAFRALARAPAPRREDVDKVLYADNLWGVAAIVWLSTGLFRAFGGLEKGTDYYLASTAFRLKMGLFGTTVALELWPMITLILWRVALARGQSVDSSRAGVLGWLNSVEIVLVVATVFAASAMARGY